jgi:hypothetical protein
MVGLYSDIFKINFFLQYLKYTLIIFELFINIQTYYTHILRLCRSWLAASAEQFA